MSKNSLLLLFGSLVLASSFLGIPSSWKTVIFSILGVLVIIVTLLVRRDITTGALCLHLTEEKHTNSYKQNGVLRSSGTETSNLEEVSEHSFEYNAEKKEKNEKENDHDSLITEPQA